MMVETRRYIYGEARCSDEAKPDHYDGCWLRRSDMERLIPTMRGIPICLEDSDVRVGEVLSASIGRGSCLCVSYRIVRRGVPFGWMERVNPTPTLNLDMEHHRELSSAFGVKNTISRIVKIWVLGWE